VTSKELNARKRMLLITIKVVTIIIPLRINEEMMTTTHLSFANSLILKNALRKISVVEHITE